MGKNYLDKKLLKKANKRLQNAIKTGYVNSKFWQDEIAKIEKITGKNIKENLGVGASRLTKRQQEYLNREFAHIATSKYGSKYGYNKAQVKQRKTLIEKGYVANAKEAKHFQNIISSDIFQKVADSLEYISYLDVFSFAQDKSITVKKIENAYKQVMQMDLTQQEKADTFLDLLKKG